MSDTSPTPRQLFLQAFPYVVPLVALLVLTGLADAWPQYRAHWYIAKVLVAGGLTVYFWRQYTELRRVPAGEVFIAALIGLGVILLWITLDPYYPQSAAEWKALSSQGLQAFPHTDKVAGQFNPYAPEIGLPAALVIAFRIIGAVLVVPVVEEVFHRGWLLRFLIKDNFHGVPIGTFTWTSFLVSTGLFGLSHHEWLAGLICGAAFNGLLYWKRSLSLCVVAHAVANLGLAVWVLWQGAWQFW